MDLNQFVAHFENVVSLSQSLTYPIRADLKYCTDDNFMGRIVEGYQPHLSVRHSAFLAKDAAHALCHAQCDLNELGYGIVVVDAYRPRRAVLDFMTWSQSAPLNEDELKRKTVHYPDISKPELFSLGYLSYDSSHCYGNTVDLMLCDLTSGDWVDLGAPFDYMGIRSHLDATPELIGNEAYRLREILQTVMRSHEFEPYTKEFWHFSHRGHSGRISPSPIDVPLTATLVEAFR